MITPLPQHLDALNRANEIRAARGVVKNAIRRGEMTVAEVILKCPHGVERMTITELLRCQHRWGADRTRRFLGAIGMTETKTLGSLTDRQRKLLAGLL